MKNFAILLVILCSCVTKENVRTERQDFGSFSIELPSDWRVNDVQGIDSQVKEIVTSKGDTIHFDYGVYSSSLEEASVKIYPSSMISWFLENKYDTTGRVFINKENIEEADREKYRKWKNSFEMIDGYQAKIVEPKVIGDGLTGVYFDSLGVGPMGKLMLQISGFNLSPKGNELFLKSIRTIRIKKK
ncbi:hypothetical protein [Rufibacter quisquiliarum]|uniref:Uncharacterized protein n=1 Tax=Rufibacter quisquiliarum TaxID=1549639 RepID=A0A839GP44_9BACT|nr:hypothetical protein [Rufibacter quisquiliarum]MBA9079733.1 hypothetical protein [Rufibacter quisquiliarum]